MHLPTDLTSIVRRWLEDDANGLGLHMVHHGGSRWTNQFVELVYETFRIRITAERGAFEVRFAAVNEAFDWFNGAEIARLLDRPGVPVSGLDLSEVLSRLRFLLTERDAIASMFQPVNYAAMRRRAAENRDILAQGKQQT